MIFAVFLEDRRFFILECLNMCAQQESVSAKDTLAFVIFKQ